MVVMLIKVNILNSFVFDYLVECFFIFTVYVIFNDSYAILIYHKRNKYKTKYM